MRMPIQARKKGVAIVHITRGDMGIRDDGVFTIYRAMVEVEKTLRFAVPCHVTSFRIGAADLGFFDFGRTFFSGSGPLPC